MNLTETLPLVHHIPVRLGEWKRQIASRPATNAPLVHVEQCEMGRTNEINTAIIKQTLESVLRLPIRLVINLDSEGTTFNKIHSPGEENLYYARLYMAS